MATRPTPGVSSGNVTAAADVIDDSLRRKKAEKPLEAKWEDATLLQQAHKSKPDRYGNLMCLVCRKAFKQYSALAQHLKGKHAGINDPSAKVLALQAPHGAERAAAPPNSVGASSASKASAPVVTVADYFSQVAPRVSQGEMKKIAALITAPPSLRRVVASAGSHLAPPVRGRGIGQQVDSSAATGPGPVPAHQPAGQGARLGAVPGAGGDMPWLRKSGDGFLPAHAVAAARNQRTGHGTVSQSGPSTGSLPPPVGGHPLVPPARLSWAQAASAPAASPFCGASGGTPHPAPCVAAAVPSSASSSATDGSATRGTTSVSLASPDAFPLLALASATHTAARTGGGRKLASQLGMRSPLDALAGASGAISKRASRSSGGSHLVAASMRHLSHSDGATGPARHKAAALLQQLRRARLVVNPNAASSTDLVVRRGKERADGQKKKKRSTLKKIILRERAARAAASAAPTTGLCVDVGDVGSSGAADASGGGNGDDVAMAIRMGSAESAAGAPPGAADATRAHLQGACDAGGAAETGQGGLKGGQVEATAGLGAGESARTRREAEGGPKEGGDARGSAACEEGQGYGTGAPPATVKALEAAPGVLLATTAHQVEATAAATVAANKDGSAHVRPGECLGGSTRTIGGQPCTAGQLATGHESHPCAGAVDEHAHPPPKTFQFSAAAKPFYSGRTWDRSPAFNGGAPAPPLPSDVGVGGAHAAPLPGEGPAHAARVQGDGATPVASTQRASTGNGVDGAATAVQRIAAKGGKARHADRAAKGSGSSSTAGGKEATRVPGKLTSPWGGMDGTTLADRVEDSSTNTLATWGTCHSTVGSFPDGVAHPSDSFDGASSAPINGETRQGHAGTRNRQGTDARAVIVGQTPAVRHVAEPVAAPGSPWSWAKAVALGSQPAWTNGGICAQGPMRQGQGGTASAAMDSTADLASGPQASPHAAEGSEVGAADGASMGAGDGQPSGSDPGSKCKKKVRRKGKKKASAPEGEEAGPTDDQQVAPKVNGDASGSAGGVDVIAATAPSGGVTFCGSGAHVRYADQVLSPALNAVTFQLLSALLIFQEKMKLKDPMKAKMRRRLVFGLREVLRAVKSRKAKCVVIAPNIEEITSKDGLDDNVAKIIDGARSHGIEVVFALTRLRMGKVVGKVVRMSAAAILLYDGADDLYHQMVAMAAAGRNEWRQLHADAGGVTNVCLEESTEQQAIGGDTNVDGTS